MKGYCECGCGKKTNICQKTSTRDKHKRGEPFRFLPGHHNRLENNPNWVGGFTKRKDGGVLVKCPDHPKANPYTGYVFEHILVAEEALGKHLPDNAVVHHIMA